jgi:hypothetical protein
VMGVLLNNQWSVGGNPLRPSVNEFLAQPFINYNMKEGWFLTTSPIITRTGSRHRVSSGSYRSVVASVACSK